MLGGNQAIPEEDDVLRDAAPEEDNEPNTEIDNHYEGLPALFNDEIVEPNEAPPLEEPIQITPPEGDSEPEPPPTIVSENDGTVAAAATTQGAKAPG